MTTEYTSTMNIIYVAIKYGIHCVCDSIIRILKNGCKIITIKAICDSNLFETRLDHMKYSINCITTNYW